MLFADEFKPFTFAETTVYTRLLAALLLPGIWPIFCLRLIRTTYPEGQSFRM